MSYIPLCWMAQCSLELGGILCLDDQVQSGFNDYHIHFNIKELEQKGSGQLN
jgi:hypothetical protein